MKNRKVNTSGKQLLSSDYNVHSIYYASYHKRIKLPRLGNDQGVSLAKLKLVEHSRFSKFSVLNSKPTPKTDKESDQTLYDVLLRPLTIEKQANSSDTLYRRALKRFQSSSENLSTRQIQFETDTVEFFGRRRAELGEIRRAFFEERQMKKFQKQRNKILHRGLLKKDQSQEAQDEKVNKSTKNSAEDDGKESAPPHRM